MSTLVAQKQNNSVNEENKWREQLNGTKGNTSQLDSAISNARGVSGLDIVRDADQVTTKNSDDYNGIPQWQQATANDYNAQVKALNDAISQQKQNISDYQSQLAKYNSQEQAYEDALAKYNSEMQQYTSDHHSNGSLHWTNGGYANINVNYDITWHWDSSKSKVVVTDVKMKINRADPSKRGGGYWDTWVYAAPGTSVPTFTGTFSGNEGDVPGVTGEKIWNSVSGINGVYSFITQNNKTEETIIHYKDNTGKLYDAQYDGNGKWTLLVETSRWNQPLTSNTWTSTWFAWGPAVQVTLPVPPTQPTTPKPTIKTTTVHYHYDQLNVKGVTPSTSSVSYHYDTSTAISVKIPVIPIVPRFLGNGMST